MHCHHLLYAAPLAQTSRICCATIMLQKYFSKNIIRRSSCFDAQLQARSPTRLRVSCLSASLPACCHACRLARPLVRSRARSTGWVMCGDTTCYVLRARFFLLVLNAVTNVTSLKTTKWRDWGPRPRTYSQSVARKETGKKWHEPALCGQPAK